MKTFLAIGLSTNPVLDELRSQLLTYQNVLRIVPTQNFHITVRYYGETGERQLDELSEEIPKIVAGIPRFDLELNGLGVFPNLSSPRVLWVGVARTQVLLDLADAMENLARAVGFSPENRAYCPHMTLARTKHKPPAALADFVQNYSKTEFGTISVNAVALYRSELKPAGPTYTTIKTFSLND